MTENNKKCNHEWNNAKYEDENWEFCPKCLNFRPKNYIAKLKIYQQENIKLKQENNDLKLMNEKNEFKFQEMKKDCEKAFDTNKRINAENLELLKGRDELLKEKDIFLNKLHN